MCNFSLLPKIIFELAFDPPVSTLVNDEIVERSDVLKMFTSDVPVRSPVDDTTAK